MQSNKRKLFLVVVFVSMVAGTILHASAQARPQPVSFRTTAELRSAGVRLRVLSGAQSVGLPSPTVYTLRDPDGNIYEAQLPFDFWYATQFRGRWEAMPGKMRMTVAAITTLMPRDWARDYITPSEYASEIADSAPPNSPEEWITWVEDFSRSRVKGDPEDIQPTARLSRVRLFRFDQTDIARLGIAFKFQPNPFHKDTDRWFFILLEFEGSVDTDRLERELPQSLLASLQPMAKSEAPGETASMRFQADTAVPQETERSEAFMASRQRAIDSIQGRHNWWFVETPHYVLVSDLRPARALLVKQIQEDLQTLRIAFSSLIPPIAPIEAVSVVRIFANADEYLQYMGPGMEWSGGSWNPSRGELVIRPSSEGSRRALEAWMLNVVYHEAFHQYLHYALHGHQTGVWFNEGHATFFEGAEVRGNRILFNEVPSRIQPMDRLVKNGRLEFAKLLKQSYEDFYDSGGSDRERNNNYARAWGLIYYLRKHAAQDPDHAHAAMPARYVQTLIRTHDEREAVAAALEGSSVVELEEAVTAFWLSRNARNAARRFDPLNNSRDPR